jgi:hypothetical protein
MCFDICTINVRLSIRVCGLHLVFSQQRKLGVFSHSKGPGAGRSRSHSIGWEPGSQESASFSKRLPSKGSQVPRNCFPSKAPRNRFPSKVSRQGFPARDSQARAPSKQGSQEEVPKQGFPGTGFASTRFGNRFEGFRNRFPSKISRTMFFQAKQGSQNRFSNKCFQEEVSRKRCPSKVPSKLVPKQCFQEEVPKQGSQP